MTVSLDWAAGTLGLALTMPSAATADLTGDGAVARDLEGSIDVAGTLVLKAATIAGAGTITVRTGGRLVGGGNIDGTVDNEAGTVSDAAGRPAGPLRIESFTQGDAGTLQVIVDDLGYNIIFGAADVRGTVEFNNHMKHDGLHDVQQAVLSESVMSWNPSCRITTGKQSHVDHWKPTFGVDRGFSFVKVHYVAGPARHC